MLTKFYFYAWVLIAATFFGSLFTGSLDGLGIVTYSLIAVVMVYGFALWSVLRNPAGQIGNEARAYSHQGGANDAS